MGSTASDQCALDANGKLKDASEIEWHYDKDSTVPMTVTPSSSVNNLELTGKFSFFNFFFTNINDCQVEDIVPVTMHEWPK